MTPHVDTLVNFRVTLSPQEFKAVTLALRGKARPADAASNQELAVRLLEQVERGQAAFVEVIAGSKNQAIEELRALTVAEDRHGSAEG